MAKKRAKDKRVELEGLSQEEASRRVGCAQSTIGRAIRRGDIDTLTNGRIPESEIEKLIELRKEDERASQEHAALERRTLIAETEKAEAMAELKKMQAERESGRFVQLDQVERAGADAAERILSVLRAIPQRVAMALECGCRSGAVVEAKIRDEVERAVGEMRQSLYLQVRQAEEQMRT
jgi:hypothetical protein